MIEEYNSANDLEIMIQKHKPRVCNKKRTLRRLRVERLQICRNFASCDFDAIQTHFHDLIHLTAYRWGNEIEGNRGQFACREKTGQDLFLGEFKRATKFY